MESEKERKNNALVLGVWLSYWGSIDLLSIYNGPNRSLPSIVFSNLPSLPSLLPYKRLDLSVSSPKTQLQLCL